MKLFKIGIIAAALMAFSLPIAAQAQQTQFGSKKPVAVGGGYGATGAINFLLTDIFGNLCNVGPVAIGGSFSGYYPVVMGGVDGSGNVQQLTIGTTTGGLLIHSIPGAANGVTMQRVTAAGSTNATSIKASNGNIYGWSLFNTAAYIVYVKFYNKASAPTVGTDTPVFIIGVPAGGSKDFNSSVGMSFSTGVAYAITKGVTDADTTATLANDLVGVINYK